MNFGKSMPKILLLGLVVMLSPLVHAGYAYLNDANSHNTNAQPMNNHGFPRIILAETKNLNGTAQKFSKYHIIGVHAGSIKKLAQVQAINPNTMFFWEFSPRAYQGSKQPYCKIGNGPAFESSGPTTQMGPPSRGCSVYAGHWLYQAGTTLTQSVNATTKTLKVANISSFKVGEYVVIYDAPAGSFKNAEHARITGKNTSTKTLTLAARGFKSVAKSHPSGAIVAQHVQGQGLNPQNWSYNMSTKSPLDGNGKTAARAIADWMKANAAKDQDGKPVNIRMDGIYFDADFYYELKGKQTDANNDLVVDHGVSASGVNWWGKGMENFYQLVRNHFPNKYIAGGNSNVRGLATLNGTQMEGFPATNRDDPFPRYDDISKQINRYFFHMHNNKAGPLHSHNLNKNPTKLYPEGTGAPDNSVFRLSLGLTLMDDGYFGHENSSHHPDPWYDEFAVNVTPGSPQYGHAVARNATNESAIRSHLGWLGNPQGRHTRIYDDAKFASNKSLVGNGTFESNLNGWSGTFVNVSRDTSSKMDGSASLRASAMTSYKADIPTARVKGPLVATVKDKQYTLVFAARSSAVREITASVGTKSNRFIIGPQWGRVVMTFKAKSTGNQRIVFGVGREALATWFDSVYFFEGNANVLRRDFENGIVIANATPSQRTINLGGSFLRIKGTQDGINNGATVSSVTIKPWDAAILVRPDDDRGGPGPNTVNPCGKPNYNKANEKALVIWKDCNGSGRWHVRGIAGNTGGSVLYKGSVDIQSGSNQFSNVVGFGLESRDVVRLTSTKKKIVVDLKMWDGYQDGLDFTMPPGTTACFNITPNNRLIVGRERNIVSGAGCLK